MKKEDLTKQNLSISNYTNLVQIPIDERFDAAEDGVFLCEWDKEKRKFVRKYQISQPITIESIVQDRNRNEERVNLSFKSIVIDEEGNINTVVKSKNIPNDLLTEKEGISALKKEGFKISSAGDFKTFLNTTLINIDRLNEVGIETDTKRYFGSSKYGFEKINGEYNFSNFVGIDSDILPDNNFAELDNSLFCKKGTLEGQINFLELIAENSKCKTILQLAPAMSVAGVVRCFLGRAVAIPFIIIQAPSSTGKGFIENIIVSIWGRIADNRLIVSSDSSTAGLKAFRDRAELLSVISDDVQPILDTPGGDKEIHQMAYEQTNGINTIKANANRTISEYQYTWNCPLIANCETEGIDEILKNGSRTRALIFKTGLKRETSSFKGDKVSEVNFDVLDTKQHENYGHIGVEFVNKIREYNKVANMKAEFSEIKDAYRFYTGNDKTAALYALLHYSYKLLKQFDLLPKSWSDITVNDLIKFYDKDIVASTDEQIYQLFVNRILDQPLNYIPANEKLESQNAYDEREKNGQKVRGRIDVEEYNGKKYKICKIPTKTFNENIIDITKKNGIEFNKVNAKTWVDNGWIIPNSNGQASVSCTNITRKFDKNDDLRRSNETCYKLILDEIVYDKEDLELKKIQEELKQKTEAERKAIEEAVKERDAEIQKQINDNKNNAIVEKINNKYLRTPFPEE